MQARPRVPVHKFAIERSAAFEQRTFEKCLLGPGTGELDNCSSLTFLLAAASAALSAALCLLCSSHARISVALAFAFGSCASSIKISVRGRAASQAHPCRLPLLPSIRIDALPRNLVPLCILLDNLLPTL